jgi:hypothetical protein
MKEGIYASVPVDKTAAIVTSQSNCTDDIEFRTKAIRSKSRLPTAISKFSKKEHDLTGKKFGNLTVIGYSLYQSKGNGRRSKWVVKCTCGYYEVRSRFSLIQGGVKNCTKCNLIADKIAKKKQNNIRENDNDERISIILKNKEGKTYFNANSTYTKRLMVGDTMYDIYGNYDTIVGISQKRITFKGDKFRENCVLYLKCSDEECEFRKINDMRKLSKKNSLQRM